MTTLNFELAFLSFSSCVLLLVSLATIISLSRELKEQKRAVEVLIQSKGELFMKKTYAYHKPSEEGLKNIRQLRELFSELHNQIEQLTPKSREQSVALTNLETTAMWAIKAVVCNDPQSEITE